MAKRKDKATAREDDKKFVAEHESTRAELAVNSLPQRVGLLNDESGDMCV